MAGSIIGALRVTLGLDSAAFETGATKAQKSAAALATKLQASGAKLQGVGTAMSLAVTAPLASLVAKSIPAATESAQALGQVSAALKSMGPIAGRTTEQLQDNATALMHLSTFDDDEILRKVTANLLTFGTVAGEQFDRAQLAAVNLATRLGGDLQAATLLVGKALNDPVKGMGALRKAGIQLSDQQKDQVKGFVAVGNQAAAQRVILGELEKQFGGSAKAMRAATPGADLKNAWDDFQETIGGVALKILPPLTTQLARVLDQFNNLSPRTQQIAIGAAAVAAAFGPLSVAAGTLLQVAGPLVGKLGLLSGAAGLPALAPILGPLAIAVAGVAIAWQNWDKIAPYIDGVVQRTQTASTQLDSYFQGLQKRVDEFDARMGIPSKTDFLDWFGDRAKQLFNEVDGYFKGIQTFADNTDAAIAKFVLNFGANLDSAGRSARDLYNNAKTWLVDKLGGAMDAVRDKAKAVGDAFFTLYDRVVGHSYVPDMVDEIGEHMSRLQQNMVAPAHAATDKAGQAFDALQQRVSGILDRIFPDEARFNEFKRDLADLQAYAAKMRWSPDQINEASERLRADAGQPSRSVHIEADADPIRVQSDAETSASIAAALENAKAGASVVDVLRASFQSLAHTGNSALGEIGDAVAFQLIPALEKAGDTTQSLGDRMAALSNSFSSMFSAIFGSKTGGLLGAAASLITGLATRTGATPGKLPGFANGGSFAVGGTAGIDRNVLSINGIPRAMVSSDERLHVTPANDRQRAQPAPIYISVEEGALFRPVVRSEAGAVTSATVLTVAKKQAQRARMTLI